MKNQKGITLIALVITIIVLLILAGVSIAMLSGENGILTQARSANSETAKAEVREQINLTLSAVKASVYAERVSDDTFTGRDSTKSDGLASAISKVITDDLSKKGLTNTGTAVNGKYDYKLNGTTLTISYVNSVDDVPEIAGSIVLENSMTLTPAAEVQESTPSATN